MSRVRDRPINSFEATYQQLAMAWIEEEIGRITADLAGGSLLLSEPSAIAMGYAQSIHRIQALKDVRKALIEIENALKGA